MGVILASLCSTRGGLAFKRARGAAASQAKGSAALAALKSPSPSRPPPLSLQTLLA